MNGSIFQTEADWPEENAFALHAGGANGQFAHNGITTDINNDDPDLADLDGIEYDSIIIRDARIVHVTEVRMEGTTLVPVKKDNTSQSGQMYVKEVQLYGTYVS